MSAEMSLATVHARVRGSSFYAGMRALPRAEREAMYTIYAFCRAVDDIADNEEGTRETRAAALESWRADIDSLYAGGEPGRAALVVEAVRRFGLDRADFHEVINGMAMDVVRDIRWPPAAELDLYCDRVASAVGRLSVKIFGMEEAPGRALAHHLGRALQLTNILRDIDEDAAIGRVYLPAEGLAAVGIEPVTPAQVIADARIDGVARGLAKQAEAHFAEAQAILARRPRGHLIAAQLMAAAYSRLLGEMMKAGWVPPRRRLKVSKPRLLLTVLWLMVAR
jgi:squalene synthase HpnD